MPDDVPRAVKKERLHRVEALQERISLEINQTLIGTEQEILVEDEEHGKWKGRTRTNKLVFFSDPRNWWGKLAVVRIDRASPWSLQGTVVGGEEPGPARPRWQPLPVLNLARV